jgi:hypothetical protein
MRDLRAGWGARAKRNRAASGWSFKKKRRGRVAPRENHPRQLALALGVADDAEPDDDEPDEEEEDEPLDVSLLDAVFPSPDGLLSLEPLLSEPSDLEAGVAALALLSSEPLLAPGLP